MCQDVPRFKSPDSLILSPRPRSRSPAPGASSAAVRDRLRRTRHGLSWEPPALTTCRMKPARCCDEKMYRYEIKFYCDELERVTKSEAPQKWFKWWAVDLWGARLLVAAVDNAQPVNSLERTTNAIQSL